MGGRLRILGYRIFGWAYRNEDGLGLGLGYKNGWVQTLNRIVFTTTFWFIVKYRGAEPTDFSQRDREERGGSASGNSCISMVLCEAVPVCTLRTREAQKSLMHFAILAISL